MKFLSELNVLEEKKQAGSLAKTESDGRKTEVEVQTNVKRVAKGKEKKIQSQKNIDAGRRTKQVAS